MAPLGAEINQVALQPYIEEKIDESTAFELANVPFRRFLLANTREADLDLFISLSKEPPD